WERAAVAQLAAWDHVMAPDSAAAAVYVACRDAACRILAHHPVLAPLRSPLADEPADTYQPVELRIWAVATALLDTDDTTLLRDGESWDTVLAAALADAVGVLRQRLGDDPDTW